MAKYEIRPSDYVDLHENISEKNIINSVNGNEYVVINIEDKQLDVRAIDPQTISKLFRKKPYWGPHAKYNKDLKITSSWAEAGALAYREEEYSRAEALALTGSYKFTTYEVIDFNKPITCNFTINYTKSRGTPLEKEFYSVPNRTVFFDTGYIYPDLEYESDKNLSLNNEFLPVERGYVKVQALWASAEAISPIPYINEYCNARIVEKTSSSTTIEVKYCFRIWGGWTNDAAASTVLCVNSIQIETLANTIDVEEIPFEYKEENIRTERNYNLETNELMQTDLGEENETKLSYKTFQQIANNYDTDRRIISFDLLNPVKSIFDDSQVYVNETKNERYLDVNDTFSIYDEHNEYMGDFRVIQCNKIWDGAYHMIVMAQLLDDTN